MHGVIQDFQAGSRNYVQQEGFKADSRGAFRLLAQRTGHGYCWPKGTRRELVKVMPYLVEAYDLYAGAEGEPPRLLPLADANVLYDKKRAWLLAEVDRNVLRQRKLARNVLVAPACRRLAGPPFVLAPGASKLRSARARSVAGWQRWGLGCHHRMPAVTLQH